MTDWVGMPALEFSMAMRDLRRSQGSEAVLAAVREAMAAGRDDSTVWSFLGIYLPKDQPEAIKSALAKSLERNPGALRHYICGSEYAANGFWDEALPILERAVAACAEEGRVGDSQHARLVRAVCRGRLGDRAGAAEDIAYLRRHCPDAEIWFNGMMNIDRAEKLAGL